MSETCKVESLNLNEIGFSPPENCILYALLLLIESGRGGLELLLDCSIIVWLVILEARWEAYILYNFSRSNSYPDHWIRHSFEKQLLFNELFFIHNNLIIFKTNPMGIKPMWGDLLLQS